MTSSLTPLLSRIEIIDNNLDPEENNLEKYLDDFIIIKRNIAKNVLEIKELINKRNLLLSKGNSLTTAKMSADIRNKIREIEKNEIKLKDIKQTKKNNSYNERDEIINLIHNHINELKELEKNKFSTDTYGKKNKGKEEDHINLIEHGYRKNELLDINDPEIDKQLLLLAQKDKELDEDLNKISLSVKKLGEIAKDMNSEVKTQMYMIDDIENGIDKNTDKLIILNKKIKINFKNMDKQKIITYIILFILVLSMSVYIYYLISNR